MRLAYAAHEPVHRAFLRDVPLRRGPVDERAQRRPPRVCEEHLAAEPRQQLEQLVDVAPLVEDVGGEDELERPARDELAGVGPRAAALPRRARA
jgi:hypothetical protein